MRTSRIGRCEPLAQGDTNISHSGMRVIRIARRERFPSPGGRCSLCSEGDIPFVRREQFASLEGNASPRSEGAVRIARIGHAGLLFVAWQTDRHKMNAYPVSAPRKRTRFNFYGRSSEIYKPYLTMCHFSVHPTRYS